MTDIHEPAVRSYNMSQIRSRDTKPELVVRKFLHKNGLRYRLYDKTLPGKPDIVLPRYKKVIFIHGCFWHGHKNCVDAKIPEANQGFWLDKINKNQNRDRINTSKLRKLNWTVIIVWECKLKKNLRDRTLTKLIEKIVC